MADYVGIAVGDYIILSDPDKIKPDIKYYKKNLSSKTQAFIDKKVTQYVDRVNKTYDNWNKNKDNILNKEISK